MSSLVEAYMKLILILFLLIGTAYGALPSDQLTYHAPPGTADLRNVNADVAKGFAVQDGNLTMYHYWEVPNIGHYASWAVDIEQEDPDLTPSQQAVMEPVPSNATGANVTAINSTTLVYL